jgi:hypothetical protein
MSGSCSARGAIRLAGPSANQGARRAFKNSHPQRGVLRLRDNLDDYCRPTQHHHDHRRGREGRKTDAAAVVLRGNGIQSGAAGADDDRAALSSQAAWMGR